MPDSYIMVENYCPVDLFCFVYFFWNLPNLQESIRILFLQNMC